MSVIFIKIGYIHILFDNQSPISKYKNIKKFIISKSKVSFIKSHV